MGKHIEDLSYDVVVVGSGAGGMLAAIRAADLGLRSIVIEKSDHYGGTSAVSGGAIWIPNNVDVEQQDSPQKALEYLIGCTRGAVPKEKLQRYLDLGPTVTEYLQSLGLNYYAHPVSSNPDYYQDIPGAMPWGRTLFIKPFDGRVLGDEIFKLRESYPEFKLFGRITLDLPEGGQIAGQYPGWIRTLIRVLFNYYRQIFWRRRTDRDQRLALGNAMIGGLRKAMMDRHIPLLLNTQLTELLRDRDGRISGVRADRNGVSIDLSAAKGVILASGGFEQSRELRHRYLDQPTESRWSATPRDNNTGDALLAAIKVGADTEFMNEAWWAPTICMPSSTNPNTIRNIALFWERGFPHSLCVNRLGKRFVNEAISYHQFGQAMMEDNIKTSANMPCWLVFDSQFRAKYPLGGLIPGRVVPDSKLPPDWFGTFLFKADTLMDLGRQIGVPEDTLTSTVETFNQHSECGIDEEYNRGTNAYHLSLGDPRHKPNRVLGPLVKAPFYAVRLDLGDLGTKGGPKTDLNANVLDKARVPIPGLYAVGNVAGSVMGGSYPGGGATLGAAVIFAYAAATDIAQRDAIKHARVAPRLPTTAVG